MEREIKCVFTSVNYDIINYEKCYRTNNTAKIMYVLQKFLLDCIT